MKATHQDVPHHLDGDLPSPIAELERVLERPVPLGNATEQDVHVFPVRHLILGHGGLDAGEERRVDVEVA